ncbi:MAG: hypothetical protein HWQ43_13920 [Nostoc sp. JL31]|uniref:hypothetical protein n=1 Tax=Nostoc sp. JL31 TaxID=2815395 RepID=UPI0025D0C238|nr:hypothetical protein [Nostoc sp. JL31]MBN3890209.1 hypothetical protein [Nostoc sp. JL31]
MATVAGVEILRQRQLKDSVPDLRWVSAESFLPPAFLCKNSFNQPQPIEVAKRGY